MTKTRKQLKVGVLAAVLGVMTPLATITPASAASITWAPGEGQTTAGSTQNWIGGVAPEAGDTAVFPVSAVEQTVNNNFNPWNLARIVFNGENEAASSKSYTIRSDEVITINESISAEMTGAGGDHTIDSDVTLGGDVTLSTSGVDTLTVGAIETTLDLDGNSLTLDASGGSIVLQGTIDGEGDISLEGDGRAILLAEPGDDFSPTVTLTEGTFFASQNAVGDYVINGGVLQGESGETGLLGDVTLNSGSIEPGASPGCLNVTNLTLNGGTFEVELEGNTQCDEYDSTAVSDDVDLGEGDVTLDIQRLSSFEPEVDDVFAIITYSEDSDVTGYFDGWEDGDNNTLGEYTYEINYDDDDAVTLTVLGTPSAPYTGTGNLITNPAITFAAAGAVLLAIGAVRYAEAKKAKK